MEPKTVITELAQKVAARYERALSFLDSNPNETLNELNKAEYLIQLLEDMIGANPSVTANLVSALGSLHYQAYFALKKENNLHDTRDYLQIAQKILAVLIG